MRLYVVVSAVVFFGACDVASFAQNVASDIGRELSIIRLHTAKYHDVEVAVADGYAPYPSPHCNPGGGVFYMNMAAVFDGELKLEQPDGLGYMPLPNGDLELVAVFFFTPIMDPNTPPVFLGHEMDANPAGVWEMKVWAWAHNPDGIFEYYNPRFLDHCDYFEDPSLAAAEATSEAESEGDIADLGPALSEIRRNTARYHCLDNALADGYESFPVAGNPGGIDFLYLNFDAAFDGELRLDQPEGLGYIELPNGEARLASVFFFLPIVDIDDPPTWLGYEMDANLKAPVPVWEMEAWVWYYNPNGVFDYYNPRLDEDS
jgi:hypothetical protein